MSGVYNYSYYHNNCGNIPYEQPEVWNAFFGTVADRSVADFAPKTVLDAGCAMGYLVSALRDRGIEAYGIDISDYALSHVREDIQPFCVRSSLTDPLPAALPQHYDLVITIEVLEHLTAPEGKTAIRNLCRWADAVLFSSTGDDFTESTHINVQQKEYWAALFAGNGFFNNLFYDPSWLTPFAALYCREQTTAEGLVEKYERFIRQQRAKADTAPLRGSLYFDMGNGFSEENKTELFGSVQKGYRQSAGIPAGCVGLRFDPVEGSGCMVSNVKVRTEKAMLAVTEHNGFETGGIFVFRDPDPRICFTLADTPAYRVELEADVVPFRSTAWVEFCQSIEKMAAQKDSLKKDAESLEERYRKLFLDYEAVSRKSERESADEKALLRSVQKENDSLSGKLRELSEQLEKKESEIRDYGALVLYERGEKDKFAASFNEVLSSRSWRITRPLRFIKDLLTGKRTRAELVGIQAPAPEPAKEIIAYETKAKTRNTLITGHPVDPIETIIVPEGVKRINLVTDTLDAGSLLGGVATALIISTMFARKNGCELRIITRNTAADPLAYTSIIKLSGTVPAEKVSFYSDHDRFEKAMDYKLEVSPEDIFIATSWWSAQAIKGTGIRNRFFYIIQEVETFFYCYGPERLCCDRIMKDRNIDFIVNSHYLFEYFAQNESNIADNGCFFEPAFPRTLFPRKRIRVKDENEKRRLFFYARPNNPRNLFGIGIELIGQAIDTGILDTDRWDVYLAGQDTPEISFSNGAKAINCGRLSWEEYAAFLAEVDLGLCLMYTPHPSYPPYDVACSGGVVLTNRMLNKQSFEQCANVILTDIEDEKEALKSFSEALALACDYARRTENFETCAIPDSWEDTLGQTMEFLERRC